MSCDLYCLVIREQIQNAFITQTGTYLYTPHFPSVFLVPLSCSKILSSPKNLLLQLIIFLPTTPSIWNRCGQFNGKWMSLSSILDMNLFYHEYDFIEDCGTELTESNTKRLKVINAVSTGRNVCVKIWVIPFTHQKCWIIHFSLLKQIIPYKCIADFQLSRLQAWLPNFRLQTNGAVSRRTVRL